MTHKKQNRKKQRDKQFGLPHSWYPPSDSPSPVRKRAKWPAAAQGSQALSPRVHHDGSERGGSALDSRRQQKRKRGRGSTSDEEVMVRGPVTRTKAPRANPEAIRRTRAVRPTAPAPQPKTNVSITEKGKKTRPETAKGLGKGGKGKGKGTARMTAWRLHGEEGGSVSRIYRCHHDARCAPPRV